MRELSQSPAAPSTEQIYSQYQSVVEQLKILESQITNMQSVVGELEMSLLTISSIKSNDADEEIIIPIGGMISLKAKLSGIKEILVNVGSGVILPLDPEAASKHIIDRKTEMNEYRKKLSDDHVKLSEIAQNLQNHLNQLSKTQ